MKESIDILNNREIAILFWLALFLLWAFSKKEIRTSFKAVLRCALNIKILTFIFVFYIYIIFTVWSLNGWGLWDFTQTKNTLIWSFFVGVITAFKAIDNTKGSAFFKRWIWDNLRIIIIIEFIISFYTFPLIVELIVQPIIITIAMVAIYAENKSEYAPASKLCDWILLLAGVLIIGHAIHSAWADERFISAQTFQDFYTPLFLSIALTPFLYGAYIYSSYERVFSALSLITDDKNLKRYMKFQAIFSFGTNIDFLDRWRRNIMISKPKNKQEIKKSIFYLKEIKRIEANPPSIDPDKGWSPYNAQRFLEKFDITAGDYHEVDGMWSASSRLLKVGAQNVPGDTIHYYIEGDISIVKKIKLFLNVSHPKESADSEEEFVQISTLLYEEAIGQEPAHEYTKALRSGKGVLRPCNYLKISVSKNEWQFGKSGGYDKEVIFENVYVSV